MTSAHNHNHFHQVRGARLFITMILNFVITVAEVIGGIISGSLSLISDALHNFSDGIAIIISYAAIRMGERPQSRDYTFGLKRAEILAAVLNSSTLIGICAYLFVESYRRLISPEAVTGSVMILVATVGLFANVIGTLLLREGSRGNMNIRSAYLHLMSDAVSSFAVLLGGIAIYLYDVYWLDPILTILISLYIIRESFHIVKDAVNVLMMAAPSSVSLESLQEDIETIPGVRNVHHAHIWMLDERTIHFEAHVEVDDMPVSESSKLAALIEEKLHQHHISHVTLQLECGTCDSKVLIKEDKDES